MIDGAVRDLERVRELGFSLWGSRVYAGQGYRKDMGMVNVPVIVGGLLVHPGDVIVADADGILSVPASLVGVACDRAAQREKLEEIVATEARSGASPSERHPNFEIRPELLARFVGDVHRAGITWSDFAGRDDAVTPG